VSTSLLPTSLRRLLDGFRLCFSSRTFITFIALTVGLIAAPARRTVCSMFTTAGMGRMWHHSRAHRFFATTRWNLDHVGLTMMGCSIRTSPCRSVRVILWPSAMATTSGKPYRPPTRPPPSGCVLGWAGLLSDTSSDTPGPAPEPLPGVWTPIQLDGEGWQIARYEPCRTGTIIECRHSRRRGRREVLGPVTVAVSDP
jgi:hypothetical protein